MKILVINAGSSSLKYQLLDPDTKQVLAKGLCERIGLDGHIKHTPTGGDVYDADRYMPDHEAAIKMVLEVLTHNHYGVITDMAEIDAVGHRVVHGGEQFTKSVIIDRAVLKGIEDNDVYALIVQDPFRIGYTGVKMAVRCMRGEKISPRNVSIPSLVVHKENLEEMKKKYPEALGL